MILLHSVRKAIKSQVLSCQGLWFAVRFSAHRDGKFKLQAEESLGRARPVIRGHCSRNTVPPGMLLLFWLCSNTQFLAVQPKFNCTTAELQWAAEVPGCCHKTRGMRVQFRGQCSCVWSYWVPGQPSQALSPSPQISCGAFRCYRVVWMYRWRGALTLLSFQKFHPGECSLHSQPLRISLKQELSWHCHTNHSFNYLKQQHPQSWHNHQQVAFCLLIPKAFSFSLVLEALRHHCYHAGVLRPTPGHGEAPGAAQGLGSRCSRECQEPAPLPALRGRAGWHFVRALAKLPQQRSAKRSLAVLDLTRYFFGPNPS